MITSESSHTLTSNCLNYASYSEKTLLIIEILILLLSLIGILFALLSTFTLMISKLP